MGEKRKHSPAPSSSPAGDGSRVKDLSSKKTKSHHKYENSPTASAVAAPKAEHLHVNPDLPNLSTLSKSTSNTNKHMPPLPPITDQTVAQAVFTHASTVPSKYSERINDSYERLEWVGDAYIEIFATRLIYSSFSQLLPGKMSQLRQNLVCNNMLAGFAKHYGFQERLKVQAFVVDTKSWTKVLADVFEAYVAAVVMDDPETGFQTAENWMAALWAEPLSMQARPKKAGKVDSKTRLASKVCIRDTKLEYKETRPMDITSRKGHQKAFIGVYLTGWGYSDKLLGYGEAPSKTEAGMIAAEDAMENNRVLVQELEEKKRVHETKRKTLLEEASV